MPPALKETAIDPAIRIDPYARRRSGALAYCRHAHRRSREGRKLVLRACAPGYAAAFSFAYVGLSVGTVRCCVPRGAVTMILVDGGGERLNAVQGFGLVVAFRRPGRPVAADRLPSAARC